MRTNGAYISYYFKEYLWDYVSGVGEDFPINSR